MTNQVAELRLTPKELSLALQIQYGIRFTPAYIRAIRTYSIARGELLFIAGGARVSELHDWLIANRNFSRAQANRPPSQGIGYA
jgi:hypothetical protein